MDTNYISYCSGIMDGEGSIYLSKSRGKFKPGLSISMNDIHGLEVFKTLFGGKIRIGKKRIKLDSKNNAYARAYIISYGSYSKIKEILSHLLPFLRVKKEQAETMLDFIYFHDHKDDFDSFYLGGQKSNFYRRLKALKKKNWNYD